jgi:ABC-2 type transport system ATP-binding protein
VHLAQQGRTVLVSSHLLSEMALMAQDLVVIGRGRLIEQCSVADFIDRHSTKWVHVRSPQIDQLVAAISAAGGKVRRPDDPGSAANSALVFGMPVEAVGELAASHQFVLHELTVGTESLEDAFLTATAGDQEYRAQAVAP